MDGLGLKWGTLLQSPIKWLHFIWLTWLIYQLLYLLYLRTYLRHNFWKPDLTWHENKIFNIAFHKITSVHNFIDLLPNHIHDKFWHWIGAIQSRIHHLHQRTWKNQNIFTSGIILTVLSNGLMYSFVMRSIPPPPPPPHQIWAKSNFWMKKVKTKYVVAQFTGGLIHNAHLRKILSFCKILDFNVIFLKCVFN